MFRINYRLKKPNEIIPWGETNKTLHWFGLTDGLLWIDADDSVIYEYSEVHTDDNGRPVKYNDYQLSRFLEDFSGVFPYVAESIPEYLYDSVATLERDLHRWETMYLEKSDEDFSRFEDELFEPLSDLFYNRSLNSSHLICGPLISCFRCGEKLKLVWDSDQLNNSNASIWKYPSGTIEMEYSDFVAEVSRFFGAFFRDMDNQVADVVKDGIPGVYIDMDALVRENKKRKDYFGYQVDMLTSEGLIYTDWDIVKVSFQKMKPEICSTERQETKDN